MTRSAKKTLELEILRKVFSKKRYRKYTSSERPDFIIHGPVDFGIEIVEFYPDETVARLHNRPNYAEEVTNKSYIHKDDVSKLEVVTTEYQDPKTGKWKKLPIPAVMQENLPITDRLALLVQTIESKSTSLEDYSGNLGAIDLIVHDSRNTILDGINNEYTLKTLKNFQSTGRFQQSSFRNIYIVLPPSKGVKEFIISLK